MVERLFTQALYTQYSGRLVVNSNFKLYKTIRPIFSIWQYLTVFDSFWQFDRCHVKNTFLKITLSGALRPVKRPKTKTWKDNSGPVSTYHLVQP